VKVAYPRVLIFGAGLMGLSCAYYLKRWRPNCELRLLDEGNSSLAPSFSPPFVFPSTPEFQELFGSLEQPLTAMAPVLWVRKDQRFLPVTSRVIPFLRQPVGK